STYLKHFKLKANDLISCMLVGVVCMALLSQQTCQSSAISTHLSAIKQSALSTRALDKLPVLPGS
ncbi:hypothetical protein GBF38_016096, partial [Nibea albiflora]